MVFEEKMFDHIRSQIMKQISSTDFIKLEYHQRQAIPQDIIDKAWKQVDWNKVMEDLKPEFHRRICNAIIGGMETEIKTDVKKLMAVDGFRQKLRMQVYPEIMKIIDNTPTGSE